ncbi:hypothetical protein TSOC_005896 [Tetrabaena socialis]|uniref:Uncharacterized protein n=1 Tax=Tetrabaena socialis TaxID=47790 RepID=A0A2J8A540_9CHLO|nr:hypothetical protein TSOC_005896 [Tetrabaena socialis]|eukprot:PNH07630.1 hypothetical protein TSOC_005896 [Tetrabaena socialis]
MQQEPPCFLPTCTQPEVTDVTEECCSSSSNEEGFDTSGNGNHQEYGIPKQEESKESAPCMDAALYALPARPMPADSREGSRQQQLVLRLPSLELTSPFEPTASPCGAPNPPSLDDAPTSQLLHSPQHGKGSSIEPPFAPFDPDVWADASTKCDGGGSRSVCPLLHVLNDGDSTSLDLVVSSPSPLMAAISCPSTSTSTAPTSTSPVSPVSSPSSVTLAAELELYGSNNPGVMALRGKAAVMPTKYGASYLLSDSLPFVLEPDAHVGLSSSTGGAGDPYRPYDPGGSKVNSEKPYAGTSDATYQLLYTIYTMWRVPKFIKFIKRLAPAVEVRLDTAFVTYLLPKIYRQCRHGHA